MTPRTVCPLILLAACAQWLPRVGAEESKASATPETMMYADASRLGKPYSKDPSVIRFGNRYLLYFSLPAAPGKGGANGMGGWSIGIAESSDLVYWHLVGELLPAQEIDKQGLCAPGALVLDGKVHLFYQSYGNGPKDAICHAVSSDGIHFERDPSNPVFRPEGSWTVGRAIDAEAFAFGDKLYLYYATRDPGMKIQQIGVAAADRHSDFSRANWKNLSVGGPVLKPELPWEQACIEAPTVCRRGDTLYMFYAGAYNNAPQQIGCAMSKDAIHWTRTSSHPLVPNGGPGEWNASESGHPGVFVDADGQTYLFYQGNNDKGGTWFLSCLRIGWKDSGPYVIPRGDATRDTSATPK